MGISPNGQNFLSARTLVETVPGNGLEIVLIRHQCMAGAIVRRLDPTFKLQTVTNGLALSTATILRGRHLVHAVKRVEMEPSFELEIAMSHCLVLMGVTAPLSAPVTTLASATCDHVRFTGTSLSGLNFPAVAKPAGWASGFAIDIAQIPNLVTAGIIVLSLALRVTSFPVT